MKGETITKAIEPAKAPHPLERLAELTEDPLTQLTELLAELNPRKGHEVHTKVNKRHILGANIVVWIEMGGDDELADTALHTDTHLIEQYRLLPNQAIRFTAYANFPDRDQLEYDLIYVLQPSGQFKTQPYATIEVPPQPTAEDEV